MAAVSEQDPRGRHERPPAAVAEPREATAPTARGLVVAVALTYLVVIALCLGAGFLVGRLLF